MLKKENRLRKWEVERVLKKGNEKKIGNFIVKYLDNNKGYFRWNVVLSRKFEKQAVVRNLKRRQIYEAIRLTLKDKNQLNFDIILIPMKKILACNYDAIALNINEILKELYS